MGAPGGRGGVLAVRPRGLRGRAGHATPALAAGHADLLTTVPPDAPPPIPERPVVGVGAVLVHEGRVLLIRRGKMPLLGRWVVPGGTVELGEGLEEALVREIREEAN
ncbi:MAG TPA: NUDIX domain-containing protein, partial [Vicinamibacteria bacterium]|nr:NUDIX domain-containing protein [Vicinamibacteria bacterium]